MSNSADRLTREYALDPLKSFAIRAPAGSGKTTLLTNRILRLLATVDSPELIVAMTFTKKAAQEMRERVINALNALKNSQSHADPDGARELAKVVLERDSQLNWHLIENPSRLRIMTIDSFSQSLVRQMPISSGVGEGFSLVDDPSLLYQEAARNTLLEIKKPGYKNEVVALLRHFDNNWGKLENLLAEMLSKREQWLVHISSSLSQKSSQRLYSSFVSGLLESIDSALTAPIKAEMLSLLNYACKHKSGELSVANQSFPNVTIDSLPVWQSFGSLFLTKNGQGTWRRSIAARDGFPASKTSPEAREMKSRWKDLVQLIEKKCPRLAEVSFLPAEFLKKEEWDLVVALIQVMKVSAAHITLIAEQHGITDFATYSMAALRALGDEEQPSDLALSVDYRIQHLLMDEFQDTSNSQYKLLTGLTSGWSEGDGRTLFVVGDPMQSIYRFRGGNVSLFERVLENEYIGSVKVIPLTLTLNFRSQARLVDWINLAIPQALESAGHESRYFVTQEAAQDASLEPVVICGSGTKDDLWESEQVYQIICALKAQHADAKIGLLVRSRTHVSEIVKTLSKREVAISSRDINPLDTNPVILDLLALSGSLIHRGDRAAWFAMLRAPWSGLSLKTLEVLSRIEPTIFGALCSVTRDLLDNDGEYERCVHMAEVLSHAQSEGALSSFSRLLENVWLMLGAASIYPLDAESVDAEMFFSIVRQMESESVSLTAERLRSRVKESYSNAGISSAVGAVEVMTIHRAKGLEFDFVILPGLGRITKGDTKPLLLYKQLHQGGTGNVLMSPLPTEKERVCLYDYLRYIDSQEAKEESIRLLYVALTRARKQVFLLGHAKGEAEKIKPAKHSFFSYLWPAIKSVVLQERDEYLLREKEEKIPSHYEYYQAVRKANKIFPGLFQYELPSRSENLSDMNQSVGRRSWSFGVSDISSWTQDSGVSLSYSELAFQGSQSGSPNITRLALTSLPDIEGYVLSNSGHTIDKVEFVWAGALSRHIGTVTHHLLELINIRHYSRNLEGEPSGFRALAKRQLLRLGVPKKELPQAVEIVLQAIQNTLSSSKGAWIFSGQHSDVEAELSLSYVGPEGVEKIIVDRTFVDSSGVRWIIDFKTGDHSGSDLIEYLDSEQVRYRPQLERYAEVMSGIFPQPIMLGLYFPLLSEWREWSPPFSQ